MGSIDVQDCMRTLKIKVKGENDSVAREDTLALPETVSDEKKIAWGVKAWKRLEDAPPGAPASVAGSSPRLNLTNTFGHFIIGRTLAERDERSDIASSVAAVRADNYPQDIQMPSHFYRTPQTQTKWRALPIHPRTLRKRVSAPELMERTESHRLYTSIGDSLAHKDADQTLRFAETPKLSSLRLANAGGNPSTASNQHALQNAVAIGTTNRPAPGATDALTPSPQRPTVENPANHSAPEDGKPSGITTSQQLSAHPLIIDSASTAVSAEREEPTEGTPLLNESQQPQTRWEWVLAHVSTCCGGNRSPAADSQGRG
jgi:hypothetical protein